MQSLPDPLRQPLMSPSELMDVSPMKRSAIYEAMKSGDIPTVEVNGRLWIPTGELRRQWKVDPS